MMRHYCTLFDRNYLSRGLALHRSLLRHARDFRLHILCLDPETREVLGALGLAQTELVALQDLEAYDPELRRARAGRKPVEYYFTCKSVLMAYVLERWPDLERLTYLDSDLFFFADPEASERALAAHPVALSSHSFTPQNAHRLVYGRFNAGWVSVGGSGEARRFIAWWRERCLEWCRLVVEERRFGDQKYLDQVPELFPATATLSHPGINGGPWNMDPLRLSAAGGIVRVGDLPLVIYHFHGVRNLMLGFYESGLGEYGVPLTPDLRRHVYRPYVCELARCAHPGDGRGLARELRSTIGALVRGSAVHAYA